MEKWREKEVFTIKNNIFGNGGEGQKYHILVKYTYTPGILYMQPFRWSPVADMVYARRNAGVITYNGILYVIGGDDGTSNLASVEVGN